MTSYEKIGLIGGGNMAEAIVRGLIKGSYPATGIMVSEPNEDRRNLLAERYGIEVVEDNNQLLEACDLLVLAVKPQVAEAVLSGISRLFSSEKLLVSIAAGTATGTLEKYLGGSPRVVRAMPNTPALVGEGATALCGGRFARGEDLVTARNLFESVGMAKVVNESMMDAVTGLSGSGPAYIYMVIESLIDGGVQEGLPRDAALTLATQTVLGAAKLLRETGEHPAVLRDQVCSPGGTTIAAVKFLEERGLRATLMGAVTKATERSSELGKSE